MARRSVQNRPRPHSGDTNAESLILDAAERLLATKRLGELSVGDIIDAAGISRTTFYFYFSSKFAVVGKLLEVRSEEFWQGVLPWLESSAEAEPDEFRRSAGAIMGIWHDHGPLMCAVVENLALDAGLCAQWTAIVDRFVDAYAAFIDAGRAAGSFAPGMDSRMIAAGLVWAVERVLYVGTLGIDPRFSGQDDVAEFFYLLWHGAVVVGRPGTEIPASTGRTSPKRTAAKAPARSARRR